MKKRKIVGILGLGLFGSALARQLANTGIDVIACDLKAAHVNELDESLTIGVVGNFTDIEFMRNAGFGNCDVIVIGTGANLEAAVLGVINAQELGVPKIIAKAKNQRTAKALSALGVDRVILPEEEIGSHLGNILSHQTIEDMINLDSQTAIVEFLTPKQWVGKELDVLNLRNNYDLNIIGIRKQRSDTLNTYFSAHYKLQSDDLIVAVANIDTFEKVDYLQQI